MKGSSKTKLVFIGLTFLLTTNSLSQEVDKSVDEFERLPTCECGNQWLSPNAISFVSLLVDATKEGLEVWEQYHLGGGAIILNAGQDIHGLWCVGLWLEGELISYKSLLEKPKLLTPMYGYFLNYENVNGFKDSTLLLHSQQSAELSEWLDNNDVRTAVILPVDFPEFGFKISTLKKVQLALHESFHVEVQIRHWITTSGKWPNWDIQPNRKELASCYTFNENVARAIIQEQDELSKLIIALLENDKTKISTIGDSFIKTREGRYRDLTSVKISRPDPSACSCEEAEAILELEEGIADFASWSKLFELNLVSREDLIKRYTATQNEPFYLTGAMLMHSIFLMRKGDINETINEITESESHLQGSLFTLFKKEYELLKIEN